ncbi:MAG: MATE family efflux transporter, partial [Synergistaceae bacterium]|nr:MATE family efflux transporter [Synergistaceae bacterium]
FKWRDLMMGREYFTQILKIGLPAGLQGSLFSISNITIQTAINSLGSYASAGSAAALNFDFLTYYVVAAFTQAAVTFTSQNFGAGDYARCKRVFSLTMLSGVIFTGIVCLGCAVWDTEILSLYTVNPEVLKYAEIRMIHAVAFLWMCNIYEVSGGCLRGMGRSMLPTVIILLGCCVLRIVWVYTAFEWEKDFALLMDVYPVSWTITGTATMIAYYSVRRKLFA